MFYVVAFVLEIFDLLCMQYSGKRCGAVRRHADSCESVTGFITSFTCCRAHDVSLCVRFYVQAAFVGDRLMAKCV